MGRQHAYMMLAMASAFSGPQWADSAPGPDRKFGRPAAEIEREQTDKRLLRKVRDAERLRAKIEKNRLKRGRKAERDAAVG